MSTETGSKMRLTLVTLGTTLASLAVVGNAFYQKKQFYPSIVFLTKSSPSIAVLYAQAFVLVFLFGKAMRKIFFGQLRAAEVEHLIEKFWYVITETCLAFTVFRDDFSARFVALFTFLLFMKAFHWLLEDRVDYMERSPFIRFIFHVRVISLLIVLGTIDSILIHHAFKTTVASGASVQMVFGFEYAILLTMVVATFMKYTLHVVDYSLDHPWENRNVYLLYGELITGFVKCCLYLAFVVVMVKIHTFPLFAIRPMYLTIRGFKKSLSDVILSRRAIAYMNTRFQDVNEEELQRLDITTCIICRDRLVVGKKLPCNHIFHTHCLRSWFQRQQSCPTCRLDVLTNRRPAETPNRPGAAQPPPNNAQQPAAPAPGQPPQPPGFMNMPPPQFGMFPQPPIPAQPPTAPSQAPSTTQSSSNTTTTNTNTAFSSVPPSAFTFPNPSMPSAFPQMPNQFPGFMPTSSFGMPSFFPPPPPIFNPPSASNMDLSALSVEQLLEMEGQERENVESRIRVLRNVHSLLDAVILQLNQYSNVINNLNAMDSPSSPHSPVLPPHAPQSQTEQKSEEAEEVTSSSKQSEVEQHSTSSTSSTSNNIENIEFSSQLSNSSDDVLIKPLDEPSSPDNELRRRRLERFESLSKKKNENEDENTQNDS
ncbi:E3 ubiquitin-protein ligase synoviolin B-like [Clytia hemisphaerica]|uniref:RING-type E3 ubiquitin transferase n=1 Tax=Clytia hemisphaerica TaxID=252671 RepID=A0A7M6DLP3_9CNID